MKRAPLIVIIVLGALVVGLGAVLAYQLWFKPQPSITSYAECVAAGYPVLESYPEQCRTPDGQTFTNPDATPLPSEPTSEPTGEFTSEGGTAIILDDWAETPVGSPLTLSGQVPGNWSSEGRFPVQVTDRDGQVLAEATAVLDGDWMTEELVPFSVTVEFDRPAGDDAGFLVLTKENLSGLPEDDDALRIPVTFS